MENNNRELNSTNAAHNSIYTPDININKNNNKRKKIAKNGKKNKKQKSEENAQNLLFTYPIDCNNVIDETEIPNMTIVDSPVDGTLLLEKWQKLTQTAICNDINRIRVSENSIPIPIYDNTINERLENLKIDKKKQRKARKLKRKAKNDKKILKKAQQLFELHKSLAGNNITNNVHAPMSNNQINGIDCINTQLSPAYPSHFNNYSIAKETNIKTPAIINSPTLSRKSTIPESLQEYFDTNDLRQLLHIEKQQEYCLNEYKLQLLAQIVKVPFDYMQSICKLLVQIPTNLLQHAFTIAAIDNTADDVDSDQFIPDVIPATPPHVLNRSRRFTQNRN